VERLQAREDFDAARFKAFRRAITSMLRRRGRRLISLDRVLEAARLDSKAYAGVREIPLDRVVGSAQASKSNDFDAAFLPLSRRMRSRWAGVYETMVEGGELPAIEVYKLAGSYYVVDGHHRVSVSRSLGRDTIKARVTEIRTRAPLPAGADPAALLCAAEYAAFLETTQLDRVRPQARLEVSRLGRYDEILAHILGHRYFLGVERGQEVSLSEAAPSWYDNVYVPIAALIRRHGVLESFSGWTETDLYVEVTRRWLKLSESGADSGPSVALESLLDERSRRRWRRRKSLTLS
jgi:uncharacterized ParB-like nuclease family protein